MLIFLPTGVHTKYAKNLSSCLSSFVFFSYHPPLHPIYSIGI